MEEQLKRVTTKLQQLLKQYLLLRKENEQLNSKVKELSDARKNDLEAIDELKQQVMILKSAAGQMTETDKKAFEKRINQYIKEVDKCINLLGD